MSEHGPSQSQTKVEMRNALFLQLASLVLNRQRLCSQINSLSSFNSLLPAEIKAAIFYKAVQLPCPLYDGDGEGEPSVVTPLFLGKICRDWRDLVWSSPLLWSNIHSASQEDAMLKLIFFGTGYLELRVAPFLFALPAGKSQKLGSTIPQRKS